jgi:NTP pyrophosphatase (non-canonical NTP hydrolase)
MFLNGEYMNELKRITEAITKFRDKRDWEQFHNPKDLAVALNIEAGELLEAFLWKKSSEADPEKVKEELADIFNYAFLLAEKYDFDIEEIILEKLQSNTEKYPVEKAKGSSKKYTDL